MPFTFKRGDIPLLVSFPHSGTDIPDSILSTMTEHGRSVPDTDWFLPKLYDFSELERASQIHANFSRYVIDPNRPPDGANLYPGQPTPELCPTKTFSGEEIYLGGVTLMEEEIQKRKAQFWTPYHNQIRSCIDDFLEEYGFAMLFDVHSIASEVPRLFDGKLPDFSIGTNHGKSCGKGLQARVEEFAANALPYSAVVNSRFVGGYITRNYGDKDRNVHAVQLELSQATYMNEVDQSWDQQRVEQVRPVLRKWVDTLLGWIKK